MYLKLLCDALENGSIALNDTKALPEKIEDYYKAILQRYAQDTLDGDALLAGLYTFAAAKDYLTFSHLALINKLGEAQVERVGSTLKEVLYENPLTEDVLDYQLFHESFREYLQREKALKIIEASERIIDFCATWQELEGSWEQRYCLQHYASHLNESKKEARQKELLALFQNEVYTSTQKKVLKQFEATKKLYQLGLLKAGEVKENDAQLEAALFLVDLKYEEANDAPQIVALVANNEIDLALQRIEGFGGNDKEGLQRKFIVYMLCLMELTLLDSKEKNFRKIAIEKILKHFDEQMPIDHSILNWNDFFPSYIIFLMSCELAEMGLDYYRVFKRTDYWDSSWLSEKGPYSSLQFEVLLECIRGISDLWKKSSVFKDIITELAKQGRVEEAEFTIQEALTNARGISNVFKKINALLGISNKLAKQGRDKEAESIIKESNICVQRISNEFRQNSALSAISIEQAKQGRIEEALVSSCKISQEYWKKFTLLAISTEQAKRGSVEEAASAIQETLTYARGISDEDLKISLLKDISLELAKQSCIEEARSLMQEALTCAHEISGEPDKSFALMDISVELAKQDCIEEAIACAIVINSNKAKSHALKGISTELVKKGRIEEAFACVAGIYFNNVKISALKEMSTELSKQGQVEVAVSAMQEAILCARGLSGEYTKISIPSVITNKLAKQGLIEEALVFVRMISDESRKNSALSSICTEQAKQGRIEEALVNTSKISQEYWKNSAVLAICTEQVKQCKVEEGAFVMQEALTFARGISDEYKKISALLVIINILAKQGQVEEATSLIHETLDCAREISFVRTKNFTLKDISTELAKYGFMEEAYNCALEISDKNVKISALSAVSTEQAIQGHMEDSAYVMQEVFQFVRDISDECKKISALLDISNEQLKQGLMEESVSTMQKALNCAHEISSEPDRSFALIDISVLLAKQDRIKEAIACTQGINDESEKNSAIVYIITELVKKCRIEEVEKIGLKIQKIAMRHECWKQTAKTALENDDGNVTLLFVKAFKNEEARLFYLKGWVEGVNLDKIDRTCLQEGLKYLVNDSESIETLLQKYAINQLFFGDASKEQINRLNKTLNIQWAIDIKNQFPSFEEIQRLSTNVDEWLHEIEDEDDRDDIADWAKRVKDDKWTEEKFQEKIQEKLKQIQN